MSVSPDHLKRLVWVSGPAALYFFHQAFTRAGKGAPWEAASLVVMGALVAIAGYLSHGRLRSGWRLVVWLIAVAIAVGAWISDVNPAIRIAGFTLLVVLQIVAIVRSRRRQVPFDQEIEPLAQDDIVRSITR